MEVIRPHRYAALVGANYMNFLLHSMMKRYLIANACISIALLLGMISAYAAAPAMHRSHMQAPLRQMLHYIDKSGVSCNARRVADYIKNGADPNGHVLNVYPLILALVKSANQCARTLIAAGARSGIVASVAHGENTALDALAGARRCDPGLLRKLVKLGANPNYPPGDYSPLQADAIAKNVKCAAALIAAGANVNYDHGGTPLIIAQWPGWYGVDLRGRFNLTKLLLAHGANPNMHTKRSGMTALFSAVGLAKPFAPCVQCAKLLLKAGANPNVVDSKGQTPLLWALDPEHGTTPEAIRVLVSGGANVNLADPKTGETPLMAAAARGNRATLDVVLDAGANRCMRDKKGRTASDYARAYHHLKVAALLACRAH